MGVWGNALAGLGKRASLLALSACMLRVSRVVGMAVSAAASGSGCLWGWKSDDVGV